MQYQADSPEHYINQLPEDRKEPITKLSQIIKSNLPHGFEEDILYGMIGYYVPHTFVSKRISYCSRNTFVIYQYCFTKNTINFYHMAMYAKLELHDWFVNEFPKHSKRKLDMGKSCMRFKHIDAIPYELLAALCKK